VLCGGCVDVCPTQCLKLTSLADLEPDAALTAAINAAWGEGVEEEANSAILKDEDPLHSLRLVRPAVPGGCDHDGTRYLCHELEVTMTGTPGSTGSRLDPEPVPRRDFLGSASVGTALAAFCFAALGMLRLPKAAVLSVAGEEVFA